MKFHSAFFFFFVAAIVVQCTSSVQEDQPFAMEDVYPDIQIAGAMKNVMWKGELGGVIRLDTISGMKGQYGLGPVSFLTGEILINDGKIFVSKVLSDSTMEVSEVPSVEAPFFVYGSVTTWKTFDLPATVKDLKDLEAYIDGETKDWKRPFAFKLTGMIPAAEIHIQNLPEGTKVSSPQEAHQGQTNYALEDETVEIIGFFSTDHQGVFTHHDSFLHMHLITADHSKMGHLDQATFEPGGMKLHLPVK